MGYDLHIVRTKDWTEAATAPITKQDVDALIAADSEVSAVTRLVGYFEMRSRCNALSQDCGCRESFSSLVANV